MKAISKLLLTVTAAATLALPALVQAQHYVPGVEGIKGGSVPPPGFYVRDYNAMYVADDLNGPLPPVANKSDLFVYANVLRGIWITDIEVLGGNFGVDVLVPFIYQSLDLGAAGSNSRFGVGDVYLEPALVAWHQEKFDAAIGYSIWVPTGDFKTSRKFGLNSGKGAWGHMFTAGGTVYIDQDKTWAVSLLNRYEINHEQDKTGNTLGNTHTLEWGVSKTLEQTWDVGLVGYVQHEVTKTETPAGKLGRSSVFAVGPEVSKMFPEQKLGVSFRYNYEFVANDRPEGHTLCLTLTKIW